MKKFIEYYSFFFYYYPSLYIYNVLGGSVNNRATIPLYIKFELCYRKSVAKRLNEKKSNSNINKYKQSVHIICTFVYIYVCIAYRKNTIRNDLRPRRGIGAIFLPKNSDGIFSFNIALNFTRILPTKKKKKKVICN